ncbi:YfjI family protein [Scandinavium sp. H11S7]|uniref:YfjI family protein n=1 Tax=Scandinavium hiltneri TaxID=2926519 RepID=A0ABT2E7P3_9ENTR|nr:YfjI family protein [Scandinavium hiltneri]MCS2163912.1 YfjI family protein [Scandinavium hiltneri]
METIYDPGEEYDYVIVRTELNDESPINWQFVNSERRLFKSAKTMPKPEEQNMDKKEFPIELLGKKVRDVILYANAELEVSYGMAVSTVFSAISFTCQNYVVVEHPVSKELLPPTNYFMSIAESTTGKSFSTNILMKPVDDLFKKLPLSSAKATDEHKVTHGVWRTEEKILVRQKGSKDPEIKAKADKQYINHLKNEPKAPKNPPLLYENTDIEGFIRGVNEYPEGLLKSTEGAYLSSMSREFLLFLSKGYSNEPVSKGIRGKHLSVTPNLTALVMMQCKPFYEFLCKKEGFARECGLVSRFNYFLLDYKDDQPSFFTDVDSPVALENYYKLFTPLLDGLDERIINGDMPPKIVIRLTDDAVERYREKWDEITSEILPGGKWHHIKEIATRSPENALRLASSLQFFKNQDTSDIGVDALNRAFEVMDYYLHQAHKIFYPLTQEFKDKCEFVELGRDLYEWIRDHNGNKPFPKVEISRGRRYARDMKIREKILGQLISQGEIAICIIYGTEYVTWPAKKSNQEWEYTLVEDKLPKDIAARLTTNTFRTSGDITRNRDNTESTGPYIDVSDIKERY